MILESVWEIEWKRTLKETFVLKGRGLDWAWGVGVLLTLICSTSTPTIPLMNWVIGTTKEVFSVHLLPQRISSSCSPLKPLTPHLFCTPGFEILGIAHDNLRFSCMS